MSFFGVDVKGILGSVMGSQAGPVTLTKVATGTRTVGALAGGTNPVQTSHSARGYVSDYADGRIDGTMIKVGDRQVLIYAVTVTPPAVPSVNDRVTVDGVTYSVVRVTTPPSGAIWELQVRGP